MKFQKPLLTLTLIVLIIALSVTGLSAPQTITLWTLRECSALEWKMLKPEIDARFKVNFNMVIVPQNAFITKFQAAMMEKKDMPDFIEWMIENNQVLANDPKKCLTLPLEKYTKNSEVFKHIIPGRVSWLTCGGHIYGLPEEAHPCVLVYNDTLWKSVGVDMAAIETWDDFFIAAQKLAAEQKDGRPVHYAIPESGSLSGTMLMIWQQSGAQFLDKNGKPCFTSPAFQSFVTKWLEWFNTHTMCSWDWGNFGAMFKNGTMAAYAAPDWWIPQINDAAAAGVQVKARPLPLYPGSNCPTASWGGTFMAITKTAKNPELVYKIIEYMLYSEKSAVERYKTGGMFTPLTSVYNDPVFHQPDSRLGGQKLGELQVNAALNMPSIQSGDIFWDAMKDFNEVFPDMAAGKISVAEGLQKVQDAAMKRYEALK